jgi:hypothetical protein
MPGTRCETTGLICLPAGPGIGVTLDPGKLRHYAPAMRRLTMLYCVRMDVRVPHDLAAERPETRCTCCSRRFRSSPSWTSP